MTSPPASTRSSSHNAGGWYFDTRFDPRESHLLDAPVREALQFLQDLFLTHRFAQHASGTAFLNGEVPISLSVSPSHTELHARQGNTWEYSYGRLPRLVRGGNEVQILGFAMSARTRHDEAAWRWLRFLTTDMAGEHHRMTGFIPAWSRALRDEDIDEELAFWMGRFYDPETYPRAIYSVEVRNALQRYIDPIMEGQISVTAALEQAHEAVGALLREIRQR